MFDSTFGTSTPAPVLKSGFAASRRTHRSRWLRLVLAVLIATSSLLLHTSPALALRGDCGQPLTTGDDIRASDCLYILRAAVRAVDCRPACVCAAKGTLPVRTSDALLCLRSAVGQPVISDCPFDACPVEPGPIALASLSPSEGTIGTEITIRGSSFGFEDTLSLSGDSNVALDVILARTLCAWIATTTGASGPSRKRSPSTISSTVARQGLHPPLLQPMVAASTLLTRFR